MARMLWDSHPIINLLSNLLVIGFRDFFPGGLRDFFYVVPILKPIYYELKFSNFTTNYQNEYM